MTRTLIVTSVIVAGLLRDRNVSPVIVALGRFVTRRTDFELDGGLLLVAAGLGRCCFATRGTRGPLDHQYFGVIAGVVLSGCSVAGA